MPPNDPAGSNLVEAEIQMSLDRACVYRALAGLFKTPDEATLTEARDRNLPEQAMAVKRLSGDEDLLSAARQLCDLFDDVGSERLRRSHHAAFDESSDIRCAPTEMDQLGGVPQLELTRTFEMADVAGFYKAFGVEVRGEAGRRPAGRGAWRARADLSRRVSRVPARSPPALGPPPRTSTGRVGGRSDPWRRGAPALPVHQLRCGPSRCRRCTSLRRRPDSTREADSASSLVVTGLAGS